jgi:hypothetical protein
VELGKKRGTRARNHHTLLVRTVIPSTVQQKGARWTELQQLNGVSDQLQGIPPDLRMATQHLLESL